MAARAAVLRSSSASRTLPAATPARRSGVDLPVAWWGRSLPREGSSCSAASTSGRRERSACHAPRAVSAGTGCRTSTTPAPAPSPVRRAGGTLARLLPCDVLPASAVRDAGSQEALSAMQSAGAVMGSLCDHAEQRVAEVKEAAARAAASAAETPLLPAPRFTRGAAVAAARAAAQAGRDSRVAGMAQCGSSMAEDAKVAMEHTAPTTRRAQLVGVGTSSSQRLLREMDVRCDRLAATNAAHLLQSPLTHQPLSRRNTHALVTIAAVSRLTAPPPVPIPSSASAAAATSDGAVMVTLAAARCRMAVPAEWVRVGGELRFDAAVSAASAASASASTATAVAYRDPAWPRNALAMGAVPLTAADFALLQLVGLRGAAHTLTAALRNVGLDVTATRPPLPSRTPEAATHTRRAGVYEELEGYEHSEVVCAGGQRLMLAGRVHDGSLVLAAATVDDADEEQLLRRPPPPPRARA